MYGGSGFVPFELGDVDVIRHDGVYHLFHLVLPNHDYIAHAVSRDGLLWRRVKNALFIGDPGEWDDDMLWTMHVTRDPHRPGFWRMFYTGISRREQGRIQRVGAARSSDLYQWEKETGGAYPLLIANSHYESTIEEGRNWVSCRDPFYYHEGDQRYLLVNARIKDGPLIRRGCVGIARETAPDRFEWLPPLFCPRMYDDIEVPSLYKIDGRYYLLGNLREDVKVHYWHCTELLGEYQAYFNNLLLPQGNYAARVLREDGIDLVWNFFMNFTDNEGKRLLPPPKELCVDDQGQLFLRSYRRLNEKVISSETIESLLPVAARLNNPSARVLEDDRRLLLASNSGYEIFFFARPEMNFRLNCRLSLEGSGKTGLVVRSDEEANAYFISLDLINGLAQLRLWCKRENARFDAAFRYTQLQENIFETNPRLKYDLTLVLFGGYIELSIDGRIILSLIDVNRLHPGYFGFYTESAAIAVEDVRFERFDGPVDENYGPI